ncbi:MAG TPA: DUF1549 domain-containing protein, partial [Tepidisphaeraceae bacterium]|nr:DUF1549 domain-containing protein [Tepidisphaeraceae bacterium]
MNGQINSVSASSARAGRPCHTIGRAAKWVAAGVMLLSGASAAFADQQAKFEVFPADVHLFTARSEQSLVCRVVQPDGVTREVTDQVQWVVPDSLMKMDHNVARPVGDGKGELKVKFQGQEVTLPVEVKDAKLERPISFRLDVMPIFMRAGCNVGSCHGSARGKDGFHLSLFGYDAEGDYDRITREMSTRRINLAIPKESLLIQKGLGAVPHTGGARFHENDELYNTLMRWIEAGVPNDDVSKVAVADSLEILPKQIVLEGESSKQQMTVRAHYSDGTVRDVTKLALFLSNNDNSATVTPEGLVTASKRGEAFVMARFATFTVGSQVIVIPKGINYKFPDLPEYNYVDQLVDAKLKKLRLEPSPLCSDEVFLRRAYSDIIGLLPTVEEHDRFMASQETNKREKLVDELLGRKEFVELWVMKFAELLKIRSDNQVSYKSALLYYNWLEDKLSHNVPMNEIVRDLLDSTGGTFKSPATNYFELERDPLKLAEDTAQVFMGMRIQCAQCHNHPFDRWTMQDYYGFAAFFSQIGRKQAEDPREQIVFSSGGGEVANPLTKKVAKPTFLGGG